MTEFTKKAVEMLLKGATLVSNPCPYCSGVRIMKEGNAFCVNCGRESREEKVLQDSGKQGEEEKPALGKLDQKIEELTEELRKEKDYSKQQIILKSISEILEVKEKLKKP